MMMEDKKISKFKEELKKVMEKTVEDPDMIPILEEMNEGEVNLESLSLTSKITVLEPILKRVEVNRYHVQGNLDNLSFHVCGNSNKGIISIASTIGQISKKARISLLYTNFRGEGIDFEAYALPFK